MTKWIGGLAVLLAAALGVACGGGSQSTRSFSARSASSTWRPAASPAESGVSPRAHEADGEAALVEGGQEAPAQEGKAIRQPSGSPAVRESAVCAAAPVPPPRTGDEGGAGIPRLAPGTRAEAPEAPRRSTRAPCPADARPSSCAPCASSLAVHHRLRPEDGRVAGVPHERGAGRFPPTGKRSTIPA